MMTIEELIQSGFANISLLEILYTKYQTDPWQLDEKWRDLFSQLEETTRESSRPLPSCAPMETHVAKENSNLGEIELPLNLRIYPLIQAYRTYGHLEAKSNPIEAHLEEEPYQLRLDSLGFSEQELSRLFPTYNLLAESTAPLKKIIEVLREIYCGSIGIEYMGIQDPQMELWLQKHIEPTRFKIHLTIDQKKMILQHLNKSELFESFLHTKYVGQKRFSLEGGETLIPVLAAVIETGADLGLEEYVLGMAHRGRLNVLSNIFNKSYGVIFSEFEEGYIPDSFEGSGDVKYHKGFASTLTTSQGHEVKVTLAPNPSHLEAVNPVVQGQVRAKQVCKGDRDKQEKVIPVIIHGDAAITGQGVVYETMQMYHLEGYSTGGTLHIVINNQIGFTTLPGDARSTHYCTDLARTFNAPVFHVNAEDPEGCVYATILAMQLRQKFHCDVFIDLVCYRKYGHNESDEPAFTQPIDYQTIRQKKPIREIYRDYLISQGILEKVMAEALEQEFKKDLQEALAGSRLKDATIEHEAPKGQVKHSSLNGSINTAVPIEKLREIGLRFCHIPKNFTIHKKLEKVINERREMSEGKRPLDWGMGEFMAYATLLWEEFPIRISGQDSCRGTFSHRHAQWMDQTTNKAYYPLKHLREGQGMFDVFNSPLSEYAVLGFEYGYSIAYPKSLVIWEAQFGDFCNGAQIIIDQFMATGEMKWAQKTGMTLLLPHGYEGQGPEHSSARMERFLALCGDQNMLVANPTEPVQLFHLLRRQVLTPMNKPLIIFTPKGLLRHPACVNQLTEFTQGTFQEVIDDPSPPKNCEVLVLCSGKIFYDLIVEREKRQGRGLAIVRVEQLYPLNQQKIQEYLQKYKGYKKFYWVQEEPENMGAWDFIRPILESFSPAPISPKYIGRRRSASPAVGSFALHKREHQQMMHQLFGENQNTSVV